MPTLDTISAVQVEEVFKRDDIRGIFPTELNAELVARCGQAFAAQLVRRTGSRPTVAVGHDARLSSPELAQACMRGILAGGGEPVFLGLVSTEQIYFTVGAEAERFAGGAMITASHNPPEYNGIKFVYSGARPLGTTDLDELQAYVSARLAKPACLREPTRLDELVREDVGEAYARMMLELSGWQNRPNTSETLLTVVVDAGNGVGWHAFEPIAKTLRKKGIRVLEKNGVPDGNFPTGNVPNPLLPEFVEALGKMVREEQADLGVGFDGDGDRAGFVDSEGLEITGSQILVLVGRKMCKKRTGRKLILRNICCSQLVLDKLLPLPGVKVLDTPVGHGKIKQLMRHPSLTDDVVFAGEHSGHYFYPEFFHVDSGTLTALQMITIALEMKSQSIDLTRELAQWREKYAWSGELNAVFKDLDDPQKTIGALVGEYVADAMRRVEIRLDPKLGLDRAFSSETPYNLETISSSDLKYEFRGSDNGWWFVVRPSGNEPKLRLNVEAWGANAHDRMAVHRDSLIQIIESHGGTFA
ncbi:MAG: hypothetical protein KAI66_23645 [Lentisphaeria bacterium]|nr:hypothetical protein [Lentisphaeria bacterium]